MTGLPLQAKTEKEACVEENECPHNMMVDKGNGLTCVDCGMVQSRWLDDAVLQAIDEDIAGSGEK